MIISIFTSNYSISRSILTLEDAKKVSAEGADSIIEIAQSNNLKTVWLLEDSFIGFKTAHDKFKELDIQLIFGVRFSICNNRNDDEKLRNDSAHKIIIFAKNDNGCRELMKLYSLAHTTSGGILDYQTLKEKFSPNLQIVVPFYDSFIHRNNFYGRKCLPDLSFCDPWVFFGEHGLPFDELLRQKTLDFAAKNGYKTCEIHHIYYKKREDISSFVTYKIITNRKAGKPQTLDRPEIEEMGSAEFCYESFQEKQ